MKEKTRDRIRHIVKRFYQIVGLGIAINTVSIPITYLVNDNITPKGETAVFTSGNDGLLFFNNTANTKGYDFLMYVPVTLRQNLEGNHVVWHSGLTVDKTLDALADEKFNNVIFVGHVNNDRFEASDGSISNMDVYRRGITKKDGVLIQYTCGSKNSYLTLDEALLKDPENNFSFDGRVNMYRLWWTATKHLFAGY